MMCMMNIYFLNLFYIAAGQLWSLDFDRMMRLAPNANGQKFDIFSCEFVTSLMYKRFVQRSRNKIQRATFFQLRKHGLRLLPNLNTWAFWFEFSHKYTKFVIMPTLVSKVFTTWKQKIQWQNVTPSEYWTQASNEPLIPSPTLPFLD